jgi:hypothetical protein
MKSNTEEAPSLSTGFWRSIFEEREDAPHPSDPLHCDAPLLHHAEIAAVYMGQRVAGDFYEFLRVSPSRMLFVLLDIAGVRADTREILIAVQKTFRILAPELLSGEDCNETTAMIELCHAMNRTIMRGGLRSCPLVAITRIWGRSAMPTQATHRGCFATTRESRNSMQPGCPWACSRTRHRARLPVTLCPARRFWWSPAGSSKRNASKETTRLRNSDWTGRNKPCRTRPLSPRASYA